MAQPTPIRFSRKDRILFAAIQMHCTAPSHFSYSSDHLQTASHEGAILHAIGFIDKLDALVPEDV